MKYKVGDTVRIRFKEWIDAQEKDLSGDIARDLCFTHFMFRYAGQTAKITRSYSDGTYELDIDGEEFGWADWMFDPDYKADGPLSAKDAVIAMVRDGEPLFDKGGRQFYWDNNIKVLWHTSDDANDDSKAHIVDKAVFPLPELYRRPKKHKRLMSRSEALNWANSEASRGWAVRWKYDDNNLWSLPKRITYIRTMDQYLRAQLIPDLFGVDESTIQGFEVEE